MIFTVRGVTDWLRAKPFWLVALLAMSSWQTACGQATEQTPQQTNEKIQQLAALAQAHPVDSPIGSGDLLHIDVFDVPELSRDVRVGDAGDISYPLIPAKIAAAGLTTFQLEEKLEQLLIENGLVSHPQVSVFVREQNSQPISVVGAVQHTMVYQVIRPTTLLEVLSAAGGITDDAGSVVIVTRPTHSDEPKAQNISATDNSEGDQQIITIRLQDLLESGNAVYNIPVYGGDVVSVPRAGIVYVLGFGVAQPGGYVLQSHG
jgi:polysaccharide export outer membrane protein